MAKKQEIIARSFVRFRDSEASIPMETVNKSPDLRKKFDEGLKNALEAVLPTCPSFMQLLAEESV